MKYQPEKYWSSLFSESVDARSVCYPEWPLSYNRFLHRQQLEKLEQLLHRHGLQPEGKSIVEIGPGSGFWTAFFRHHRPAHYLGLDISAEAVRTLSIQFPEFDFRQADIGDPDTAQYLPSGQDLIYAAMVFLHITDNDRLRRAFQLMSERLTAGGHLIFLDAVYTRNIYGNARKQADTPEFNTQYHNKIRPLSFYRDLAEQNGMEITEILPAFNSSQYCFDFSNRFSYLIWGKIYYALHRRILSHAGEGTGQLYARFQSVLDRLLTDRLHLSMSSKWVIMKKKLPLPNFQP